MNQIAQFPYSARLSNCTECIVATRFLNPMLSLMQGLLVNRYPGILEACEVTCGSLNLRSNNVTNNY
jgi:hypothetical protein